MGLIFAPDTRSMVLGVFLRYAVMSITEGVQNYIDRGNGRRR